MSGVLAVILSSWVLVLTSLAACMISLDSQVVATALSTIRLHLGASIEELEWTVNAYTLSFAVLLMTGAALGDRFGRQRLFVAGLGLFVLASAACALAPNAGWLIAAAALSLIGAIAGMALPGRQARVVVQTQAPERSESELSGAPEQSPSL